VKELTEEIVLLEYESGKSFRQIAETYGTYQKKVRKLLIAAGGVPRDKSSAQKTALQEGRATIPTEGRSRTPEEKEKISKSLSAAWSNFSDEKLEQISDTHRKQWQAMSEEQRQALLKKGRDAARATIDTGSKLEISIIQTLKENGYTVEFHKDDLLENPKLQVDIYVPDIATVIEIDGPSHFFPVWGEDNLRKTMEADLEKTGLLISRKIIVIRVQNKHRNTSLAQQNQTSRKVMEQVEKIKQQRPAEDEMLIEIEV
jgi:very-short-patch-repair endonuclease